MYDTTIPDRGEQDPPALFLSDMGVTGVEEQQPGSCASIEWVDAAAYDSRSHEMARLTDRGGVSLLLPYQTPSPIKRTCSNKRRGLAVLRSNGSTQLQQTAVATRGSAIDTGGLGLSFPSSHPKCLLQNNALALAARKGGGN